MKIRASGMCGSHLHTYRSRPGTENTTGTWIAGHEPAGVIHTVGIGVDPAVAAVGDRVMVHHFRGCTTCDLCRSDWPHMCRVSMRAFGIHEHGAHAPLMRVPAATIIRLDDALSFEASAAVGCGTGTAWGGPQRDAVVDFAGFGSTTSEAVAAVRRRGKVVQVGLGVEHAQINVSDLTLQEIDLLGSCGGDVRDNEVVLKMMAARALKAKTTSITFEEVPRRSNSFAEVTLKASSSCTSNDLFRARRFLITGRKRERDGGTSIRNNRIWFTVSGWTGSSTACRRALGAALKWRGTAPTLSWPMGVA